MAITVQYLFKSVMCFLFIIAAYQAEANKKTGVTCASVSIYTIIPGTDPLVYSPAACPVLGVQHTAPTPTAGCSKFRFLASWDSYSGTSCPTGGMPITWNFGDGTPTSTLCIDGSGCMVTHQYTSAGVYTVIAHSGAAPCFSTITDIVTVTCVPPPPCSDCISSFAPIAGKKYLVSAWAKESGAAQSVTAYTKPQLTVLFPSVSGSAGPFIPTGAIIDGWQRIEGEFTIPASATDISLKLDCTSGDCFYDDVRVLPFDGSMKSYVYDPVTMRLVAELDERNYATLYEYDEEGKLIRVKKETEKGIMTIQENRNNTKK